MLYTEMVVTKAVLRGDKQKLLKFSDIEKPLALQVGGSDKKELAEVAKIAEELDHHPDWSNSWNTVEISITNHQAGGITEVDLYMCARIEETAERWGN